MQGAARENVAIGGAVHQFQAFALCGELQRVLPDDVTGAQAVVDGCTAARLLNFTAQRQRGAGWRASVRPGRHGGCR